MTISSQCSILTIVDVLQAVVLGDRCDWLDFHQGTLQWMAVVRRRLGALLEVQCDTMVVGETGIW